MMRNAIFLICIVFPVTQCSSLTNASCFWSGWELYDCSSLLKTLQLLIWRRPKSWPHMHLVLKGGGGGVMSQPYTLHLCTFYLFSVYFCFYRTWCLSPHPPSGMSSFQDEDVLLCASKKEQNLFVWMWTAQRDTIDVVKKHFQLFQNNLLALAGPYPPWFPMLSGLFSSIPK